MGDGGDVCADGDLQLALWMLFELHFRGFDDMVGDREWDPDLLRVRQRLERCLEGQLREATSPTLATLGAQRPSGGDSNAVVALLEALVSRDTGPSLAAYLQRQATPAEFLDFLRQRSIYHLKESDPHSFVLARLDGPPKVALAELQYDEYGGGRPQRLHASMFADALLACGLDRTYGAYIDQATAQTLAANNVQAMFGLSRRLRGAAMGHLAVFEATSSLPCRRIASGVERLGLPDIVAAYFREHVEADAVHEQVAMRDICAGLVAQDGSQLEAILFGAAACLYVSAVADAAMLRRWHTRPELRARRAS